jgi:putative chitinase
MADRVVYGLSFSENGWRMVDQSSCEWIDVPGTNGSVSLQIQAGQPARILGAWAADWNAYVEPLRDRDSACWTPTNSVASSNHLSGTACDLNWDSHPFRIENAGLNQSQIATVREMLDFYEDTVFWGNDWDNPKDTMHVQMGYNTYGSSNFKRVQSFIDRKIRRDGFSTFRRGPIPAQQMNETASDIIASAMGNALTIERYKQLTPGVLQALQECGCNNEKRIAMWMAQIGHESGGLRYMEEIADGSAYEGREDLGNFENGDGKRFKGRGPIQITGRSNYKNLSEWAHEKGLVPEPDFFVDNPEQLGTDKYGFLGVIWYWTVARPQINSLCDAGDINSVTRAINGGLNGIEDRVARWQRAGSMGSKLMTLVKAPQPQPQPQPKPQPKPQPPTSEDNFMSALSPEEQRALYNEIMKQRTSKSPLRHVGEGTIGNNQDIESYVDANVHVLVVDLLARLGDPHTLSLLSEISNMDLNLYPDRKGGRDLAWAILENAKRLASGQATQQVVMQPQQSYEIPIPAVVQPVAQPVIPVAVQPAVEVFQQATSPELLGDGLYSELNNFRSLLREATDSISQSVKGN